jgi:hypothetical protein
LVSFGLGGEDQLANGLVKIWSDDLQGLIAVKT